MLKTLGRRVSRLTSHVISKTLKKKKRRPRPASPPPAVRLPSPSPSPLPSPPEMPRQDKYPPTPFLFPKAQSTVLPDPSPFFSPDLLSSPLPTNSSFQNFVLKNGDQPEYIHPYLIKSLNSSLSISFPSRFATSSFIYQTFNADLTISSSNSSGNHIISSFNDLSVTLDLPPSLRFFLVRGSPFVTCSTLSAPPRSPSPPSTLSSPSSPTLPPPNTPSISTATRPSSATPPRRSTSPNPMSRCSPPRISPASSGSRSFRTPAMSRFSIGSPPATRYRVTLPFLDPSVWSISGRRRDGVISYSSPTPSISASSRLMIRALPC